MEGKCSIAHDISLEGIRNSATSTTEWGSIPEWELAGVIQGIVIEALIGAARVACGRGKNTDS